jgi:AcrR family transcriptional regulator
MAKVKRKELELKDKKAVILELAKRDFAQRRFCNTSVAEIASAFGFAIGTPYHFFNCKEQLYATIVNQKPHGMCADILPFVSLEFSSIWKIEALIRSHFFFAERNLDFCQLFTHG